MIRIFKRIILLTALITLTCGLGAIEAHAASSSSDWQIYGSEVSLLKSSQKKIFNKAVNAFDSKYYSYRGIMLLFSEKTDGTNYAFLSIRTSKTDKTKIQWVVLIINKDKKGNCALLSINQLSPDNAKTLAKPATKLKWAVNSSSYKKKTLKPAEARKAFSKAVKTYKGSVKLTAVTYLAKKKHSGSHYKALCLGKNNGVYAFYIADVYKNKKGKCSILTVKALDAAAYLKIVPSTLGKKNMTTSEKDLRNKIVKAALSYVGKTPYVAGGNSLKTGTDCSGFVHLIYAKFNITTKRSSADFVKLCNISYKDLLPGDVVVYEHHVAIYIGNDKIVHAKGSKYGTVKDTMWYKKPLGYVRIIK